MYQKVCVHLKSDLFPLWTDLYLLRPLQKGWKSDENAWFLSLWMTPPVSDQMKMSHCALWDTFRPPQDPSKTCKNMVKTHEVMFCTSKCTNGRQKVYVRNIHPNHENVSNPSQTPPKRVKMTLFDPFWHASRGPMIGLCHFPLYTFCVHIKTCPDTLFLQCFYTPFGHVLTLFQPDFPLHDL